MVCDDVKRIVYFYLDGQLGSNRVTEVQSHLTGCRSCDDRLLIQKRLRAFILRHLSPERAPDHLRLKLHEGVESMRRESPA
jgi:mycothiol system anti-sigma-R factor